MISPDPPSPIAIHGAPRSGTTWLGQIFNSHPSCAYRYQPLFSYAFKNRIDFNSSEQAAKQFLHDLLHTEDQFVLQTGEASLAQGSPKFEKDPAPQFLAYKEVRYHQLLPHLMSIVPELRLVAIVRDPRDVLRSWRAAPREYAAEWNFASEWDCAPSKNAGQAENFYGYSGWKDSLQIFQRMTENHPERAIIVRYHDLKNVPSETTRHIFNFCGMNFSDQTCDFLRASTTTKGESDPYGVYRNNSDATAHAALDSEIEYAVLTDVKKEQLDFYLDPN
ncbi:sulfotransferase family protein [Croceicoccus naphthovorans]|nr:sulfotransferase [Croceicoccus naphthovorans]MBB3990608.1 hypothetical protein [Croceicoccus naphthovorans]